MKPLKNNWFLDKYLGISEYDRPRTVCEMGRRIVTRTLMWLMVAALLTLVFAPPLVTAYNLAVMWYTGAGMETVYNDKVPTLSGIMYIGAFVELMFACIAAVLFGIHCCWKKLNDAIDRAMYERRKKQGYFSTDFIEPETPIRDFIGDLYKRFKDKTCVMLEYQDEIDEARRREARRAEWEASRKAAAEAFAVAMAVKLSDTSKPSKTTEKDDFDAD